MVHSLLQAVMDRAKADAEQRKRAANEAQQHDLAGQLATLIAERDGERHRADVAEAVNRETNGAAREANDRAERAHETARLHVAQYEALAHAHGQLMAEHAAAQVRRESAERRAIEAEQRAEFAQRARQEPVATHQEPVIPIVDNRPHPPKAWKVTVSGRDAAGAVRRLRITPDDE